MGSNVLQNSILPLTLLRERARKDLVEELDKMRGSKALVMDRSLSGPLGLIAEKQLIKDHGVEKTYHLREEPLDTDQRRIMYLVRDTMANMKIIASQIKQHQSQRQKLEYYVCFVPSRNIICERVLEDEGVYGDVQLGEYDLGLIPFEDDCLSMEVPDSFRQLYLEGDKSCLVHAAKCLVRLQSVVGLIPVIRGKGSAARTVADLMARLTSEAMSGGGGSVLDADMDSEIDELIIIDREVDYVTMMMSQLTYEGLLDDTFGISNGIVELPAGLISGGGGGGGDKKVKVQFNSGDNLFGQLRDVNFEQVGPIVKARATFLKSVQDEKDSLQGKSVTEIKEYVRKLKEVNIQQEKNLLSLHTSIALHLKAVVTDSNFARRLECEQGILQGTMPTEKYLDYCEERLCRSEPLPDILRLLCLCSIVSNGLRRYDSFRDLLVQVHGIDVLLTLSNLERLGMLKKYESTSAGISGLSSQVATASISVAAAGSLAANLVAQKVTAVTGWDAVRRRLNLVVDEEEDRNNDVSYAYSGYAPISVRLVEKAMRPPPGGWTSLEEHLKILPGPCFQVNQETKKRPLHSDIVPPQCAVAAKPHKVIMVMFIGGATSSEMSALRFLSRHNAASGGGAQIVVGTTKLTNGEAMLNSLTESLEPPVSGFRNK